MEHFVSDQLGGVLGVFHTNWLRDLLLPRPYENGRFGADVVESVVVLYILYIGFLRQCFLSSAPPYLPMCKVNRTGIGSAVLTTHRRFWLPVDVAVEERLLLPRVGIHLARHHLHHRRVDHLQVDMASNALIPKLIMGSKIGQKCSSRLILTIHPT